MRISIRKTSACVLAYLIYFFVVNRIGYLSYANSISLLIGALSITWIMLRKGFRKIKRYTEVNFSIALLTIVGMFSSLINSYNFDGTVLHFIKILTIFLFLEYVSEIGIKEDACRFMFYASATIELITLYYLMFEPLKAYYNGMNYVNGTKFSVSYNVISGLLFFNYLYGKKGVFLNKISFILLTVLGMYTCVRVYCTTGMLACIAVGIYCLGGNVLPKRRKNYSQFFGKHFPYLFMIASTIIVSFLEILVNIGFVKNFIENTLGKSITLTGRTIIYSRLGSYFKGHLLLGHGYNSVYDLFKDTMLIGNHYCYDAQNALLEYALYFGVIGVVVLLVIVYTAFKCLKYDDNSSLQKKNTWIFAYYLYAIIGIVEITINPTFYMYLALTATREKTSL